jgi:hypothetical protein
MSVFYRGVGVNSWWHDPARDPRAHGFACNSRGRNRSPNPAAMVDHILSAPNNSPFISLTSSFEVALEYALFGPVSPTPVNRAYVFQIELDDPLPAGTHLYDPLVEIAHSVSSATLLHGVPYQHDGASTVIQGVASPNSPLTQPYLTQKVKVPDPNSLTGYSDGITSARVSRHFQAIIRALRDAEILAFPFIPSACITLRHEVL